MIRERLTEKQMVGLHRWADVYVSASHGEGFDMPAFDSVLAGNRLVYTASGGPEDFASPDDFLVPWAGHEPTHAWYDWEDDAQWTKVPVEFLCDTLEAAADAVRTNAPHAKRDVSMWSSEVVGKRMRDAMSEQVKGFGLRLPGEES
jgi:hypothetical protein